MEWVNLRWVVIIARKREYNGTGTGSKSLIGRDSAVKDVALSLWHLTNSPNAKSDMGRKTKRTSASCTTNSSWDCITAEVHKTVSNFIAMSLSTFWHFCQSQSPIDMDDSLHVQCNFPLRSHWSMTNLERNLGILEVQLLYYFSGASGSRSMAYFPLATLMIGTPGTRLILLFKSRSLVATM